MLPEIQTIQTKDNIISRFLGLNQKDTSNDEMFKDMQNMTSDEYPYLSPRESSAIRDVYSGSYYTVLGSVVYGEDIYTVQGYQNQGTAYTRFFKNFEQVEISSSPVDLDANLDDRLLSVYGAYIVIFPDNVMYNTQTNEVASMDYATTFTTGASFYLSDKDGKIFFGANAFGTPGSSIKTNDSTLTTYLENTYGNSIPANIPKEKVTYDDDTTAYIYPVALVLGDKTSAEALTDKTTYPVYYMATLSNNTYSIEVYNSGMSMWNVVDIYNTYYLEFTHQAARYTALKENINEGDFIKINGLDSNSVEITEDSATYKSYWKLIDKYRNRAKITKITSNENVSKYPNQSTIDAIGFTFADPDGRLLAAIKDGGNLKIDVTNNKRRFSKFLPVIGFPIIDSGFPTACAKAVFSKDVPDMDYITVSANRIWGCSSDNHEIYACKQGDATAWYQYAGLASDSYAVTIPNGDPFTGAVTYNDMPYFFTENMAYSIMGNKPKNYQVQNYTLRGVENGAYRTIAQKDGYVYYKSKSGVERFNGNNSQSLTEYLDMEGLEGYNGATNNDKYFVFIGTSEGQDLYVYDIKKRLWHKERHDTPAELIELDNNLYMITLYDGNLDLVKINGHAKEVADILTDNDVTYDTVKWYVESGEFNGDSVLNKYITKFMFELKLEQGSNLSIHFMYNDSGEWEEVFRTTDRHVKRLVKVPIKVRRCERMRYKIEGVGKCKIYTATITFEGGSEIG